MNWEDRIKVAKERKKRNTKPFFSEDDDNMSQLWITDPISEVSDKIHLKDNDLEKGPNDIYLILDGIFFTVGVEKNDVELAENCYISIHKRVEKLYALHGCL